MSDAVRDPVIAEPRYFFIRRPVLAIVISVIITLLGIFAIRLLPISRYPQITPPAVQVQATFPGAAPEASLVRIISWYLP